ncbi:MAG TPA: hypothetical protein VFE90_06955 [Myxococcales bacterium]|jgi:D-aspartate ligase|nr:hypothetical protein [Myxococcales bacterium]
MGDWFGTLAAVRELGRRGVEVRVATDRLFDRSAWSRYARRVRAPGIRDVNEYLGWLKQAGARNPGAVLCATSDDLSFLYAAHARELGEHFRLATPGLEVIRELLDKERLYKNAQQAGISVPTTLFPSDAAEAASLGSGAHFPLLFKQRTLVLSRTLHKGTPVLSEADLREAWGRFRCGNQFPAEVLSRWPDADRPVLQEYLPLSAQRIYCIEGFIAPGGERWATRAVLKVLSHPRYLGIGLLFEHADVLPDLEARLVRLCRSLGYAGVFQCEFIEHEGEHLLIDFNPRFYNYMAFDHARGLPQAWFAYLHAIGAHEELAAELDRARVARPDAATLAYCYRLGTWTQLTIERLARSVPPSEVERWRRWRKGALRLIDPAWEEGDPGPGIADAIAQLWMALRHPRSFFRRNSRRLS